jgi:hypothetical protein
MDLRKIGWGGRGVVSHGSGYGAATDVFEDGDEPSGAGATDLFGHYYTEVKLRLCGTRPLTDTLSKPQMICECVADME